jgi:hypothetical protein
MRHREIFTIVLLVLLTSSISSCVAFGDLFLGTSMLTTLHVYGYEKFRIVSVVV